jgi:predicted RNA-binding Zn-ribbon protein involved in translation (DUF1610 family)
MLGTEIPFKQSTRPCVPRIGSIQEVRSADFHTIAAVWKCDECGTWQSAAVPSENTQTIAEPCECGHVAILKAE